MPRLSLGETFKKLNKDIQRIMRQKQVKDLMGRLAVDSIYKRTKTGYGVNNLGKNAKKQKLKKLSPNYIDFRKGKSAWFTNKKTGNVFRTTNRRYFKKPKLGAFGTPNKSNLTFTGKMLDSIGYKIIGKGIRLFIKNKESKVKAEYVQDAGRKFFNVSTSEKKVIVKEINTYIRSQLKRIF